MALINYLTRIHFADGVLEDALAEELTHLGVSRPLVIVDPLVAASEAYARVIEALPLNAVGVPFTLPGKPPTGADLNRIRATFTDAGCDAYLGLGGAWAISLARRAAFAGAPRPETGTKGLKADGSAKLSHVPVLAIPTTTECVGLAPLLDLPGDRSNRLRAGEAAMLPDVVLCDPTLTLANDRRATAAAGMDTLTHCIEAFLGTTWNPPADGIALDGIRRASACLSRAVFHGSDLAARRDMMAAALDAGLASQKGLGAAHALAHALEIETGPDAPHGYFHAALLPAVLAFNAPAIQNRLSELRTAMHVAPHADLPEALTAFGAAIALPSTLTSLALDGVMRERIASRAAEDPASHTNPRHATAADYVAILEHTS
jgi:4-hydroxybutyrate dehydrogenase